MNNSNIRICNKCLLWSVAEEEHSCPLADVQFVCYSEIDGQWFIDRVSVDGKEYKRIRPIVSIMARDALNARFD